MPEMLRNLKENLITQTELYTELNDLAELKQKALINNKLPELESITIREEQLLLEASRLEKERLLWAERVGLEMGKDPGELTLSELAEHYPELRDVKNELEKVIFSLKEAHELNTNLLHQALKVVDFTVGLLTQQNNLTYSPPNQKEKEDKYKKINFLDKSI